MVSASPFFGCSNAFSTCFALRFVAFSPPWPLLLSNVLKPFFNVMHDLSGSAWWRGWYLSEQASSPSVGNWIHTSKRWHSWGRSRLRGSSCRPGSYVTSSSQPPPRRGRVGWYTAVHLHPRWGIFTYVSWTFVQKMSDIVMLQFGPRVYGCCIDCIGMSPLLNPSWPWSLLATGIPFVLVLDSVNGTFNMIFPPRSSAHNT